MPYNNSGTRGERENNISKDSANNPKMSEGNSQSSRAKQYEEDSKGWDRRFNTAKAVTEHRIREDRAIIDNKNKEVASEVKELRKPLNGYHNDGW